MNKGNNNGRKRVLFFSYIFNSKQLGFPIELVCFRGLSTFVLLQ